MESIDAHSSPELRDSHGEGQDTYPKRLCSPQELQSSNFGTTISYKTGPLHL